MAAWFSDLQIIATLVALNYVLAIVCAIREVMYSRTSQGSIAWLMSLLFLPFPTALLYLVFGWKFFDDYPTDRTAARHARPARARELGLTDEAASRDWPDLVNVAQIPFLGGNDAQLLVDGYATFDSIFSGIARAKAYLLVQFYEIADDDLGRELARRMIERAAEGVDCYLLYDEVGSRKMPRAYRERLRAAGVKVAGFNQRHKLMRLYGPWRINYRNHRKIVVVDGQEAWVGGHNVNTDYLGLNPRFGHWRDTHVRVAGPAALACALVFREDWQWATGETFPADAFAFERTTPGEQSVLVMGSGPASALEECAIAFTDVIAQSRQRLWIVSPYFVPDVDVRTALFAAVMRGVDVRLVLPEKPDHRMVWLASNAYAATMVEHGVRVYRYTHGFLHQKVILVDDRLTGIGSVNFDNRSFNINFEITLWFTHRKMIGEVERMLEADFLQSRHVTLAEVNARSPLARAVSQTARLLSPIL